MLELPTTRNMYRKSNNNNNSNRKRKTGTYQLIFLAILIILALIDQIGDSKSLEDKYYKSKVDTFGNLRFYVSS